MKKKLFFLPLLAVLVMAGCTKEESDSGSSSGETDTHYLAVSIVSTSSAGGRAETGTGTDASNSSGSTDGSYTNNGETYEDGLAAENEVKKVRFYFFRQTGAAINVSNTHVNENRVPVNYMDITPAPASTGEDHTHSISDLLDATLIVNTTKGDVLPTLIVAVINPPASLPKESMDLFAIRSRVYDYTQYTTSENGFVMSNSSFVNDQKKIEDVVAIDPIYYATTAEKAKENPLKIYVERCVAKVRLNVASNVRPTGLKGVEDANGNLVVQTADGESHILTRLRHKEKDESGNETGVVKDETVGTGDAAKQIYAELKGWNVTADRMQSYLIKKLDDAWRTSVPDGMTPAWNISALHRCFWAAYCSHAIPGNRYLKFDAISQVFDSNKNFTYCNENAELKEGALATKVIVSAILCDENANPLTICEFAGQRFVDNENLDNMKSVVLKMMKLGQNEFWTLKDESTTEYREMDQRDIEFKSYYEGNVDPNKNNRYYVKAVLTEKAAQRTWLKRDPLIKAEGEWNQADLEKVMEDFKHLRIWKDGKTYYYASIRHLGEKGKNTEYGVVRNHVYDITVDGIYGLGTPVFNPDELIIPEPVNPDEVYIAAQVNILSWRFVQQNVTFE